MIENSHSHQRRMVDTFADPTTYAEHLAYAPDAGRLLDSFDDADPIPFQELVETAREGHRILEDLETTRFWREEIGIRPDWFDDRTPTGLEG